MSGALKIIGARVVECRIRNVIVRDSFAMLPVALEKFGGKIDIDYAKMEPDVREAHRQEIMEYLEADCRVLAKAIERFRDEFGLRLTMAGAAMKEMEKHHEFERIASEHTDKTFRDFYYGGRVECIETGIIKGDFKTYDVNSMYPAVMRNFAHPVSSTFVTYRGPYAWTILPRCDFAEVTARNWGCLPVVKDGKLTFREPRGRFFATGHEIRAGLETGTLEIIDVHVAYKAEEHSTFEKFVDHFYNARLRAKADGDKLLELFYKLVMNAHRPSLG